MTMQHDGGSSIQQRRALDGAQVSVDDDLVLAATRQGAFANHAQRQWIALPNLVALRANATLA